MKQKYTSLSIEVIVFSTEDVICSSTEGKVYTEYDEPTEQVPVG